MAEDPYEITELIHQKENFPKKYSSDTNPALRALVDGVCDEDSPLSLLNGVPHIVRDIWDRVVKYWKTCIKEEGYNLHDSYALKVLQLSSYSEDRISFPKPKNIYINMMPFVIETTFENCKLPPNLKPYWDEILNRSYCNRFTGINCKVLPENEIGKIGYLTIHESYVEENTSQRRAGLHTDCPGKLMIVPNEGDEGEYICVGRVTKEEEERICENINKLGHGICKDTVYNWTHPWGMSMSRRGHELVGGIFMASNVDNSCAAWKCQIDPDENQDEIIGHLGDVEHLRDILPGEPEVMKANTMYWMTDRTPHESLPLTEGTYRQYVRVVTSEVSLWFEEHSTKNPLGVVPDPSITKIVKGSKFVDNLSLLLDMDPAKEAPGELDEKKRKQMIKERRAADGSYYKGIRGVFSKK